MANGDRFLYEILKYLLQINKVHTANNFFCPLPSALTEGNPLGLPSAFTQLLNDVYQQDLVLADRSCNCFYTQTTRLSPSFYFTNVSNANNARFPLLRIFSWWRRFKVIQLKLVGIFL